MAFQGLPARICWLGYGERHRLGLRFNELVRTGAVSAPIVIGRDHLDSGSVASPYRETEAMADGSDAIADWPLLNALVNTASGATWVSIHHGGGVGIGRSIHAGMVAVADGTELAAQKLERVLTSDPGMGVIRHVDAGYDRAREVAREPRRAHPDGSTCGDRADRAGIVADFRRDGAVCVRQAFSPQMVALATDAIEANLAALSPNAKRASGNDDGAFVEDFCNWQRIEPMRRFISESPAAVIAGALMGAGIVRLYHDHVLVKEPGTSQRTPWHQDLPYYNVDGQQNVSMWFPVDPVAAESTLQFVAGSHRGPGTCRGRSSTARPSGSPTARSPSSRRSTTTPSASASCGWSLEPGDAVFFHMLTLHAAGGVGARRRRVLSVRFLGDDMVHAPRPWATSPPFPGLVDELAAGAPMDHPLFPVCGARRRQHP